MVVPSGPGLALDLIHVPTYRDALLKADYAVPDSGYMVLIWNALNAFRRSARMKRYSGLELLLGLLDRPSMQGPGASFWVMPSEDDTETNLAWLNTHGLPDIRREDCYIAPYYRGSLGADGRVEDPALLARIEAQRPKFVFLNIGSGVQEQLGLYLRENLSYQPAILCTGAAIAFLTGRQAHIPPWADRYFLGWLMRIFQDPKRYGDRYGKAFRLLPIMLRHRANLPPLSKR